MPSREEDRQELVRIIYRVQLDSARRNLARLDFDPDDFENLFKKLAGESETGQVLIFSSYLEDRMATFIAYHLKDISTKTKYSSIFSGGGPLSNFSDKVQLAYHLSWLSSEQRSRLDALRKLRNIFAHRAFMVTLADEAIQPLLRSINYDVDPLLATIRNSGVIDRADTRFAPAELNPGRKTLCNFAFLAFRTLSDLAVLPQAIAQSVSPNDIVEPFDEAPQVCQNLRRSFAGAVLEIFAK